MPVGRGLRATALLGCLVIAAVPRSAFADEATGQSVAEARGHFEKARAYYGQGAYREALAELQAAHALDPTAKDLVFNLGVVQEKLGDIDDALLWFETYTKMALTPQERDRADAYIRRLEGAKKEATPRPVEGGVPSGAASPAGAEPVSDGATLPPPAARGRVDAATITAGSVSVAALVFGAVMGIKAKHDQPNDFMTGRDGTYQDFLDRIHSAHQEAVIADVGFATSVVAAIATATLYFARTRRAADPVADASRARPTLTAVPLAGGGALIVQGSL
jgi:tetratricopeptide (TPR) repeat protein